jgi:hypothetical protein
MRRGCLEVPLQSPILLVESVGVVTLAARTEIIRTIRPFFLSEGRHFEAKNKLKKLSGAG